MHHLIPQKLNKVKFGKVVDLICENPSIKSRGAYLLLRRKLRDTEHSHGFNGQKELEEWLNFRHDFLNKELKEKGELKCAYCPRNDLVIGSLEHYNKNNHITNLATVDHVQPLSKGGKRYDVGNLVVACRSCNAAKGNSEPDKFEIINNQKIWGNLGNYDFNIEFVNNDGELDKMMRTLEARGKAKAKRFDQEARKECKRTTG